VLLAQLVQAPPGRIVGRVLSLPDLPPLTYGISIPAGYRPDSPRPLVLALHPGGGRAPNYGISFMRSVVLPGLGDLQAIVVAPDCPARSWTEASADRAVIELLRRVMSDFSIDRRRVLVTGFSMGGRGTWFMASRHGDLFTAAIPMAASVGDEPVDRLGMLPTYVIHSRDDQVVPFAPALANASALETLGRVIHFEALQGIGHFEMGGYVDALTRAGQWVAAQWGN
jgi:predicted peptidase